jgi:exodeoxyribonuclease VII small subunit
MADKKSGEFELAIERLEQIVKQLETGDVGLDESVKLFREGRQLAQKCDKLLGEAQKEVEAAAKEPSAPAAAGNGGLPF